MTLIYEEYQYVSQNGKILKNAPCQLQKKRQELNPTAFILPPKRTFVNKCLN